jgi:hypothetical protein
MTKFAKARPTESASNSKGTGDEPLPRAPTKTERLVTMLQVPDGVSVEELRSTFGWLKPTTRAALTKLRKKGYAIARLQGDGGNVYRIEA